MDGRSVLRPYGNLRDLPRSRFFWSLARAGWRWL
jgi:hypothetical protein